MTMPWDRFETNEPPAPSPIVEPPSMDNLPARQEGIDFGRILKDAFAQALREVQAEPTSKGSDLVKADARSRSWRTLLQGLGIDLTFAVVATLATLAGADPLAKDTWLLFSALLIKTVIQTFVSYVMRLRVTPTVRERGDKMALMAVPMEMPSAP